MAYSFNSTSYQSDSGVSKQDTAPAERDPTQPANPMRGVSNPNLPQQTIAEKKKSDNSPLKFPEDLSDEFYISFNAFKHALERPSEAIRNFTFQKSIVLPLPSNMTDGASAAYNAEDLYFAGNALKELGNSLFSKNGGVEGTVKYLASKKGLNDAMQSFAGGVDAVAADPEAAALKTAATIGMMGLSKAGGAFPAAVKSSLQMTANPFPVMIFQGTNFKPAFTFDWTFYPESVSESISLKKIIGFFRREMLPEKLPTNSSILRTPSVFEIKITPKEHARVFKRCVLTNMGINYSPNGPSFLNEVEVAGNNEKYPSAISLSLTFQEIEIWLADDYYQTDEFFFDPKPEFYK